MPSASGASNVRTTRVAQLRERPLRVFDVYGEVVPAHEHMFAHAAVGPVSPRPPALLLAPGEAELVGVLGERVDHELQVLVEVDARSRARAPRRRS